MAKTNLVAKGPTTDSTASWSTGSCHELHQTREQAIIIAVAIYVNVHYVAERYFVYQPDRNAQRVRY